MSAMMMDEFREARNCIPVLHVDFFVKAGTPISM